MRRPRWLRFALIVGAQVGALGMLGCGGGDAPPATSSAGRSAGGDEAEAAHDDPAEGPSDVSAGATDTASTAASETAPDDTPGDTAGAPEDEAARLAAAHHALMARSPADSTSLRGPNDGALRGGVAFPTEGPGYRHNPRRPADAGHGTVEVVQAIAGAAAEVHRTLGGELFVNDLSLPEGGPIRQHGSHQAGRDADVLFYLLDADGAPRPPVGAPLDPAGEGVDFRDLAVAADDEPVQLDAARTWAFVAALVAQERAPLQRIFVAEHLRTLLLEEARRVNAPAAIVERFGHLTCQPGSPHDDHFHFRFFCSAEDIGAGCHDSRPIYPWHRARMRRLGVRPVIARPRPDRPRAPTTTPAEARTRAGTLHPDVTAWLSRREAWLRPPRTGRPYCR